MKEKYKKIKMLIMDVDGTLTDGKIYIGASGEEFKAFNVKDGYGIKLLKLNGIIPAIITGRNSEFVLRRAEELGIEEVFQGIENKLQKYEELKMKYDLIDDEIAYIGDDINDYEILKKVGAKFAVANCVRNLKTIVDYVSVLNGGDGAVREIIDLILSNDI
ncbi:HAD-IIIA family hydrolase [Clostridium sp. KNHs214]|uniref:KdsC family phosphatase n=1 Tax=Clostridium sp. KNHs214 TaxID=1540257 RepID=UPI00054E0E72|nr:HAD-IIIA family hydrolase [Clostridium sp. KNHs214]